MDFVYQYDEPILEWSINHVSTLATITIYCESLYANRAVQNTIILFLSNFLHAALHLCICLHYLLASFTIIGHLLVTKQQQQQQQQRVLAKYAIFWLSD